MVKYVLGGAEVTERELIGLNYYFQSLRKINIDIIKLAGIDYLTKDNKLSETFCTVIRKITGEIIPCRINGKRLSFFR